MLRKKKLSNYTDIDQSYRNVRGKRRNIRRLIKTLFNLQFIAHLASVLTIIGIYFSGKDWKFSPKIGGDWLALFLGLLLIGIGIYNSKDNYLKEVGSLVNYEELHDLLTVARFEAESSIINIGGDLSWLDKDIKTFREIKSEHQEVQIKIYYDKHKLSKQTKELISKLQEENIMQLIPYPKGVQTPSIRCMITDYNYSEIENCKIYMYPKKSRESGNRHANDKFEWQEYTIKTNPNLYDAITSFLELLERTSKHQLIIGITGINNCGKTTIINSCKQILEKTFTVKIINDVVINTNNTRETYYSLNKQILFNQLFDILHEHSEEIIIFDRTPFDNFVYMLMREEMERSITFKPRHVEAIKLEYGRMIREMMKYFDIVYKIQRKKEKENVKTRLISPKERKCLLKLYSELECEYLPDIMCTKFIGKDSFEKDIEEVALYLANDIKSRYYTS